MNIRLPLLIVATVAAVLCGSQRAYSQAPTGQETFTEFRGDTLHSGFIDNTLPTNLALAWQHSEGRYAGNSSSPAVSHNTVYYGLGPNVFALNAKTGALEWEFPQGASGQQTAFDCSPAVEDGKVYIGNDDGNLYALDAGTGDQVWQFKTDAAIHAAPVVQDGVVYFAGGTKVYALDDGTGKEVWSHPIDMMAAAQSSPIISNNSLFIASVTGRVFAASAASGRVNWTNALVPQPSGFGALVYDRGNILIKNGNVLAAESARAGEIRQQWQVPSDIIGPPTVGDDGTMTVAMSDAKVIMLDSRGRKQWSTQLENYISAPLLLTHDMVIATTATGVIYMLDRATGEKKWVYTVKPVVKPGSTAPAKAGIASAPAVANGMLFVLSDDGTLSAFATGAPDNVFPTVTATYPGPDATISGAVVPWQATIMDLGSGVRPDSVDLTVDGNEVPIDYDPNTTSIHVHIQHTPGTIGSSYVSLAALSDGSHVAILTISDWRGNKATKSWTFTSSKAQAAPTASPAPVIVAPATISQDNNNASQPDPSAPASSSIGGLAPSTNGAAPAGTATTTSPLTPTESRPATPSASAGSGGTTPAAPTTPATPKPPVKSGGGGGGSGGSGGGTGGTPPPPPPPL